jgi:type II secretion system protein G
VSRAFTLIELLIVVAIIAILAAIAVPNFMEAQTRAKVSRAKTDLRTISVALEAYSVDFTRYPYPLTRAGTSVLALEYIAELTTPVAYLQTVQLIDPFKPSWKAFYDDEPSVPFAGGYSYCNWNGRFGKSASRMPGVVMFPCYVLSSVGPDQEVNHMYWLPEWLLSRRDDPDTIATGFDMVYDPSNGTKSSGDIGRFGGESGGAGGI